MSYYEPRRSHGTLAAVAICAVVVLAALAVAGYIVLGRHPAAVTAKSTAAARPLTCRQQYDAWKTGPARAAAKHLDAELGKVSAAGSAQDIPALTAALKKTGHPAAVLARYPMPSCADPRGYWPLMLARVRAAADNARSAPGLGSILLAEVPLKSVPGIERKLTAELKRTGAK